MEDIARLFNCNNGIVQPGTSAVPLVALVPLPSLATKDQATLFARHHGADLLPEGSDVTQDGLLNALGLSIGALEQFQSGIVISAALPVPPFPRPNLPGHAKLISAV